MNVLQLLTTVQPPELLAALHARYPGYADSFPDEAGLRQWLTQFRAAPQTNSKLTCRVYQPYKENPDPDENDERELGWTTVEGTELLSTEDEVAQANEETGGFTQYKVGDTVRWSISFTPWGQWGAMPVEDACVPALSLPELAAEVVWEITWHSWDPMVTEEFADSMRDKVEEISRGLAETRPFNPGEM